MRAMKHWVIGAMAAAALTLAGCGGGGGGSTTQAPGPTPAETQHMMVSEAIDAAGAAVAGLTDLSTDMDVAEAEAAIEAARTALHGADLLSANQVAALGHSLSTITDGLDMAQMEIDEHRKMVADDQRLMMEQRMAANTAIGLANTAVGGLSDMSADADVMVAEDAIQAAKDAVMAATALSMTDRDGLNARISTIETTLATAEIGIADERQRMGASDAVDMAMTAVGNLNAMSTDEEVEAAEALIMAAKTALTGATSVLTAEKTLELSRRISNIEMFLATAETAIALQREMDANDAETQRVADVSAARLMAMQSYVDADADAVKADEAATAAEMTSPGSAGAMAARKAAMDARMAAGAAMAAHDAIMDSDTTQEANEHAAEAAEQAMYANNGYMTAKDENNTIQTAAIVGREQLEARDLAQAKSDAEELYNDADDGVTFHYDAVVEKAGLAAGRATAARTAANRAKYARTDATAANTHATAAQTASSQAQAALMRANMAKTNADTARQAAMDATTSAEAKAALAELETANDALTAEHTGAMGAGLAYMAARDAADMAETAQGVHVISLLIHANAQDLDLGNPQDVDLATAITKARDARHKAVGDAINDAVGDHTAADTGADGDRDQDSSTTGGTDSMASAMASWEGNDLDDEGTMDVDESAPKSMSITVVIDGSTNLGFRTEAAEDDPDTVGVDESMTMPKTATRLDRGLGDFYGYQIEDSGNHAIVFTDKKQGANEVAAVTAVTARMVEKEAVTTEGELSLGTDKTGPTFAGVTWTPSGEQPLMGTLNCADAANCDIQIDAAGAITLIEGYTFTGSREAVAAVTAAEAMEDNDYLAFGVWLREDTNDDTEGTPKAFAAFANGGDPINDFVTYVTLTGSATYRGSATGVYTEGSGVDYFEGNATLTANFGAPGTEADAEADDDEIGTISGSIHGIYVGGVSSSDVINLREADIENTNTAFAGNVRMGPGTIEEDDSVSYKYNGTWSGNFYGANAAVPATDDAEAINAAAPDAVAGTFGVSGTEGEGDAAVTRSYVGAFGARQ